MQLHWTVVVPSPVFYTSTDNMDSMDIMYLRLLLLKWVGNIQIPLNHFSITGPLLYLIRVSFPPQKQSGWLVLTLYWHDSAVGCKRNKFMHDAIHKLYLHKVWFKKIIQYVVRFTSCIRKVWQKSLITWPL